MSETPETRVVLEQEGPYAFKVRFEGDIESILTDEPAPLGEDRGPNPSAMLLTAIANCLASSLLFAMRKFKNAPGSIRAEVVARRERNADGRWRIPHADVTIQLSDAADAFEHLPRIIAQFEQFCVVTQSVRDGIDVAVTVKDRDGRVLEAGA